MDRGAWQTTIYEVAMSDTTEPPPTHKVLLTLFALARQLRH